MKLYKEFEEALQETAEQAGEKAEFGGRFYKLVKNYMNGMESLYDIEDIIQEAMISGEENEH